MSGSEIVSRLLDPAAFVEALATALIFAWIAGRLLGASKRSWRSILVTGLSGWFAAVIVSTALVRGDLHQPSFRVFYFTLMLVFVMLATVLHDVWVKSGNLSSAPRFTIPHPIRTIRRRYRLSRRFAEITRIAAAHGLGAYIGVRKGKAVGTEPAVAVASRCRQALEEAGGMFVKLGQLAAGRSDVLGEEAVEEFSKLQDSVPPASPDDVRQLIEDELGRPLEDVFIEFDLEPVGSASIGQAHLARLPGGERVIVKVQRPGIAELVDRDLQIVARLAAVAEARTSWGPTYGVDALAKDFSENLRQELDYRVEANNASQVASAISHLERIHIPSINRELSTSRVMVMELLDGQPLSHVERSTDQIIDPEGSAEAMLQALVEPMFNGERFHADPHPGNVFLLADGRLGLVDFGATGRLDTFEQAAVTDILMGLQFRDPELLREAVLSVGTLRGEVDGRALERAFARFMAQHVSAGSAPSTAMLNDLLQMLALFGVLLPASTSTLFRALVTLEATIETICPGFPIIDAAQRLGGDLVRERFGEGELKAMAEQEAIKLAPVLRRLPRHVDRIATLIEQGDVTGRVSLFSTARDVAFIRDLFGKVVLAFVGATLGVLSVLLIRTDTGPALADGTSLLQTLGYIGLFLGTVLLLRVTLAALRDTDKPTWDRNGRGP
jgi:ubiquinone biosynthesis protein